MFVSSDPLQPGFDVEQRRGEPAMFLGGIFPMLHFAATHRDLVVDGFQAVRGFQALPQ